MSEQTRAMLDELAEELAKVPEEKLEAVGGYILGVVAGASLDTGKQSA